MKIDLLAPLPTHEQGRANVKVDPRRIRPRSAQGIHAHVSPEALTIGELPLVLYLPGPSGPATVHIPHPFTYLVLKLHAYRDRREDPSVQFGEYHALDLYNILAMCTESEWSSAQDINARYVETEPSREAKRIVATLFSGESSPGVLAIRHQGRRVGLDVESNELRDFLRVLHELFPPSTPS